jgi:hypothetical protein
MTLSGTGLGSGSGTQIHVQDACDEAGCEDDDENEDHDFFCFLIVMRVTMCATCLWNFP